MKGNIYVAPIVGLLLLSLAIVSFVVLPRASGGFFEMYGFTPSTTLANLDGTGNYTSLSTDLYCDLNPDGSMCPDKSPSIIETITAFGNGILKGGFGMMLTLMQSVGFVERAGATVGTTLEIPAEIMNILIAIFGIVFLVAILLLIFNRSDLA